MRNEWYGLPENTKNRKNKRLDGVVEKIKIEKKRITYTGLSNKDVFGDRENIVKRKLQNTNTKMRCGFSEKVNIKIII